MDWVSLSELFLEAAETCAGEVDEPDTVLELFAYLEEILEHAGEMFAAGVRELSMHSGREAAKSSQELSLHLTTFRQSVDLVADRIEQGRTFSRPLQSLCICLENAAQVGLPEDCRRVLDGGRRLAEGSGDLEAWRSEVETYRMHLQALSEEVFVSAEEAPSLVESGDEFILALESMDEALQAMSSSKAKLPARHNLILATRDMLNSSADYYGELTSVEVRGA